MYQMKIKIFGRLPYIPEIERFYENLPVFAFQEFANYLKNVKEYSTICFYGIIEPNI